MEEPFGTYSPRGPSALAVAAARRSFLGRGPFRHRIWQYLQKRQPCFDVVSNGAKMRLYPDRSPQFLQLLLKPDRYSPKEVAFIGNGLKDGGWLLDIGANVGAMALPFAQMPGAQILAVEPGPLAYPRLCFNIEANGFENVKAVALALSDTNGTVSFSSNEERPGLSGIGQRGREIEVPSRTLLSLLDENGIDCPAVLKIDVEGHEDAVLKPFFATAPKHRWPRRVLIEAHESSEAPLSIALMQSIGYRQTLRTRHNVGVSLTGVPSSPERADQCK